MKKKNTALWIRLALAFLNMVNLALALALALQKQKQLVPVIHTVEENERQKVFVSGGEDGVTAVLVQDRPENANQAEK